MYKRQGEFWSIPLPNNQYACGVVLDVPNKEENKRLFIAGLLKWTHSEEPNPSNLLNRKIAGAY